MVLEAMRFLEKVTKEADVRRAAQATAVKIDKTLIESTAGRPPATPQQSANRPAAKALAVQGPAPPKAAAKPQAAKAAAPSQAAKAPASQAAEATEEQKRRLEEIRPQEGARYPSWQIAPIRSGPRGSR